MHACLLLLAGMAVSADANRLAYLDGNDPYYVSGTFPKLTTPQWAGEAGVEAVVILAIDDMRGPEKWETYLRPILERLKRIDGRAPVSIMTCQVDPKHPHLQTWLKEGLSLETHTFDHPCPLLQGGDFAKARATYDKCVDLLNEVPGNRPLAFRMPCCDSLNTPTPRFYAEMFNKTTGKGNFLTIDSSVFNLFTSNDPDLPRQLVQDADGSERFRKYLPRDRTFVNTIENYPYPYPLGTLCWEFPCVTPSDWSAQHLHKPNNPITVQDWKAALDATVLKQGVFTFVFHPHGWIKSEQIIDLIDHATSKHGKKVKFLTFREAQERLDKNLLAGQPLRTAKGGDNGVRLIDVNGDGYQDVVIANGSVRQTRLWDPASAAWKTVAFPTALHSAACFGITPTEGSPMVVAISDRGGVSAWRFDGSGWLAAPGLTRSLGWSTRPDAIRFLDIDGDGRCELLVHLEERHEIFGWDSAEKAWKCLPYAMPPGARLGRAGAADSGLRFVDLDGDGSLDVIFSNEKEYGLYLFESSTKGWSKHVLAGKRGDKDALPMIARAGTDNGAWFHSRGLWFRNEDTNLLKDHVDRRSFNDLLSTIEPTAKSQAASLQALRPRPGFKVELMAAEPLVQDPIAFAWGPDGKLWVVEMGDYPLGVDGKGKHGGRVRFLEDTNGDSRYDKSTVFLEGIGFPTGVLPWRKGVLVTCAPDIFYAEDTDGDGKADARKTLYSGFVEGNQQHRVNGLVWGLDGWVYCANGDSGGKVLSAKTGQVVDIRGRDFRIRPDSGEIEALTGQTQFGRCRDDWGNWFGGNNSNPMWHYVLEERYQRRNPNAESPNPRVNVSTAPGTAPVHPLSRTLARFNDFHTANRFTSACSPIVYRDELFGPTFANNCFISEPVHNLVHREVMRPAGVTFTSSRAADEQQSEFLASSDNWFRPTMIQTGPDGALWIADMYRHVIEHPQWIPLSTQKKLDLRAGHNLGRIYRVIPVASSPRAIPRLDKLTTRELVAALDSPSGWQRDMAQMLLQWSADRSVLPLLEKTAVSSQRPLARLHALRLLAEFKALPESVLVQALNDPIAGIRRHAVQLCEGRFTPQILDAFLKREHDDDTAVRLQFLYSIGEWNDPRAGPVLGRLATAAAANEHLRAALLSSVNARNLPGLLDQILATASAKSPPPLIGSLIRTAGAEGNNETLFVVVDALTRPANGKLAPWQFESLAGLLTALDGRGFTVSLGKTGETKNVADSLNRIAQAVGVARLQARDADAPMEGRVAAIRLLGRGGKTPGDDVSLLGELLSPQSPDEVQNAVIASLGRIADRSAAAVLLSRWKGLAPDRRAQAIGVLVSRESSAIQLLDAVEKEIIHPAEIGAAWRQRLLETGSAKVRQRAAKLLPSVVDRDREKVIESYRPALGLAGDPGRGKQVFTKICAACHKVADVGQGVGPDLAALSDKSGEYLLTNILDPNRAVEARYVNYIVATKSGVVKTGFVTNESGASFTLVGPDGKPEPMLRKDIDELTSSGKSAMPEGLEKDLKSEDMADLLAFLGSALPEPKPKSFPGNKPELVREHVDGSLRLRSTNASIFGGSLVFEEQHGNLGYWSKPDDRASWEVDVPKAGRYEVRMEWACAPDSAGNTFVLQVGGQRLVHTVASTANWDTYKDVSLGVLSLSAGKQTLTMRPEGTIRGALVDLRQLKLTLVP